MFLSSDASDFCSLTKVLLKPFVELIIASVTSHKGAPLDEGDDALIPRLFYTDASAFL